MRASEFLSAAVLLPETDVEQLRDHRERDRVGELTHQLDRFAFGERCERTVHDRTDAPADSPHCRGVKKRFTAVRSRVWAGGSLISSERLHCSEMGPGPPREASS